MKCPKCSHETFQIGLPCPACHFEGDPMLLEQLGHITYLLGEIGGWIDVPIKPRGDLHFRYARQRQEIERQLGLQPPALNEKEAAQARLDLKQREYLLRTFHIFFGRAGLNSLPTSSTN
jgi:hypothetical protein